MKFVKPSFEIIEQGSTVDDMYKHIEICGRTCYKSTDKITEDSYTQFVNRMINSKHYAMLEHATVYLKIPYGLLHRALHIGLCSKYIDNKYSICEEISEISDMIFQSNPVINSYLLVTTNLRVLVENGWTEDLQYACEPLPQHAKRVTVKFICNRQVSHEFVRHKILCVA